MDHINRDRSWDAWENLRLVDTSLNNLNQYRKGTRGYIHETTEWRDRVNAYRAKKKMRPLYLKEPPRNMYISCLTYKGKRYEFGAFETPQEATTEYLAKKEGFIQERLRELWSAFLFA